MVPHPDSSLRFWRQSPYYPDLSIRWALYPYKYVLQIFVKVYVQGAATVVLHVLIPLPTVSTGPHMLTCKERERGVNDDKVK